MHKVIKSGSAGNAVVYGPILLDCGVPYSAVKGEDVKIVLLTHSHKDHLNLRTLKKIQLEHPGIRIGCCEWMVPLLDGIRNIDVYEFGKWYNYGVFKVSPIKLYHDVPNCGYRIDNGGYKIIHATDTAHLEGIDATGYDLYAIESNYDEERVQQAIEISRQTGEFTHAYGSVKSHLSHRQAWEFFERNRKETSERLLLHQSTKFK